MPTPLTYADAYKLYASAVTDFNTQRLMLQFNIAIAFNKGSFYVIALEHKHTRKEDHGYLQCSVGYFINEELAFVAEIPSHQICLMHNGNRWEWE